MFYFIVLSVNRTRQHKIVLEIVPRYTKSYIIYWTQPPVNYLYIDVNKLCDVVKYALTSLCENELQMIYTITPIYVKYGHKIYKVLTRWQTIGNNVEISLMVLPNLTILHVNIYSISLISHSSHITCSIKSIYTWYKLTNPRLP